MLQHIRLVIRRMVVRFNALDRLGTLDRLNQSFERAARAIKDFGDVMLAGFTLAEIREARAAGIPLLDYWAYWEQHGYTSPRFKA